MKSISILGVYVADLAFFADEIPIIGETIIGKEYFIGPGGKGSNQAVAAAKAGAKTFFISKIGDDQFGSMAKKIYDEAGVDYSKVIISKEHATGAAGILVNNKGQNAINVVTGAAGALTTKDIDVASNVIKESSIFLTQLEAPKDVVYYALKIAKELNYYSLGTVEFILDEDLNFYFLEVNTRIQVEHPVTEMITGMDLVDLQIDIAEGQKIGFNQEDVPINGHAIETRIYAENPENEFLPQTGQLFTYIEPQSARIDSGVLVNDTITVFFDPMIAKVITHGKNRNEAIRKMIGSLNEFHISGVTTNKNFLIDILQNDTFIDYTFDTNYIANTYPEGYKTKNAVSKVAGHAIASLVYELEKKKQNRPLLGGLPLGWANQRAELPSKTYLFNEQEIPVSYHTIKNGIEVIIGDFKGVVSNVFLNNTLNQLSFTINGVYKQFYIKQKENRFYLSSSEYGSFIINKKPRFEDYSSQVTEGDYLSPMPGEVIKLHISKGDEVKKGDPLLVMLSMKMENTIQANEDGLIEDVFVAEKSFVEADTLLLNIKKQD